MVSLRGTFELGGQHELSFGKPDGIFFDAQLQHVLQRKGAHRQEILNILRNTTCEGVERQKVVTAEVRTVASENGFDEIGQERLDVKHGVVAGKKRCLTVLEDFAHRACNGAADNEKQLHFFVVQIPELLQSAVETRLNATEVLEFVEHQGDRTLFGDFEYFQQRIFEVEKTPRTGPTEAFSQAF